MSAALEVSELTVLFGGSTPRPDASGAVSVPVSVPVAGVALPPIPPGHQLGLPLLSFSVDAGDCLAVLGVSGAGKSSLLRTLAGLQPALSGTVRVNGDEVTELAPERRSIVYLHQEPVLFPHMNVLENVAFPLTIRGVSLSKATERVFGMLMRLQIDGLMYAQPDALSGGQRHRVALARALCAEPAVLLLDEPLSSLDPAVRHDVRDALLAAREVSGAAMILVTHDLDDAMAVATHVSAIDEWRSLTPPLPPALLLDAPPSAHVAQLLGIYSRVSGTVVLTGGAPVFRWLGGDVTAPGMPSGPTLAFVRPHEVQVFRGERHDIPTLSVMARHERAHDVLLTLCNDTGEQASLRVASGTDAAPGDRLQLSFRTARFFTVV
jgi:ABC-type sulfate/molybdate transport systems ATPase subunit